MIHTDSIAARRFLGGLLLPLLAVMAHGTAIAQVSAEFCGPLYLPPAAPPWDFYTDKHFLPLVENAHFTREVETMVRGKATSQAGPDIDYTLYRFPNHPRALIVINTMAQRKMLPAKIGLPKPPECYFERAIRFRSRDVVVRMLYANFLYLDKRPTEAVAQLEYAASLAQDAPLTQPNVGLIYLEANDYERALVQAHKLAQLAPEDTTLSDALRKAGKWRDPAPAAPAALAAPAASAASAVSH